MIDIGKMTEYSITNATDLIIVALQSEDLIYLQLEQYLESKFPESKINTQYILKRSEDLGFIKSEFLGPSTGQLTYLYSITKLGIEIDWAGGYEMWVQNNKKKEELEGQLKKEQLESLTKTNKYFVTNQMITISTGIVGIVGGILGAITYFDDRTINESINPDLITVDSVGVLNTDSTEIDSLNRIMKD